MLLLAERPSLASSAQAVHSQAGEQVARPAPMVLGACGESLRQKLVRMGQRAERASWILVGLQTCPAQYPPKPLSRGWWLFAFQAAPLGPGQQGATRKHGTDLLNVTPNAEDRGMDITERLGKKETTGNGAGRPGV